MRVTQAAASALGEHHALADDREVGDLQQFSGFRILRIDQRAYRHRDIEIPAGTTTAQRSGTVAAAWSLVVGIELEVNERVAMRVGNRVHGTAHAAVAAIGPAV